jgi:hypothetical protein
MTRIKQVVIGALVVVGAAIGQADRVAASPESDAATGSVTAPADHGCTWVRTVAVHKADGLVASCPGVAADDLDEVPVDHLAPVPAGCKRTGPAAPPTRPGIEDNAHILECSAGAAAAATTSATTVRITCRNQKSLFGINGSVQDAMEDAAIPEWVQSVALFPNASAPFTFIDMDELLPDEVATLDVPGGLDPWWYDEILEETERAERSEGGKGCDIARNPPFPCSDERVDDDNAFGPDGCWGKYPTSRYELAYDTGGALDGLERTKAWTAGLMFTVGKATIVSGMWAVEEGMSFDLKGYTPFAIGLGDRYDSRIVTPLGLEEFMWFILMFFVGAKALGGRFGAGLAEIVFAILLAGLSTVLFAHRDTYMNALADLMEEEQALMLRATIPDDRCIPIDQELPPGYEVTGNPYDPHRPCPDGWIQIRRIDTPTGDIDVKKEIHPLLAHVHEVFVEEPTSVINWGESMSAGCLEAKEHIVAVGFYGGGWPERHLQAAGCTKQASFNRNPTNDRMLAALLTMLVSIFVGIFLLMVGATVAISKFLVVLLFALIPFAAVAGLLPGSGRRLAWLWLGALVQVVVTVILMSTSLALLLLAIDEALMRTDEVDLMTRWYFVLLIVAVAYMLRRQLVRGAKSLGGNVADSLTRLAPAASNWNGSSTTFDLDRVDRAVGATAKGAGRVASTAALFGAYAGLAGASLAGGGLMLGGQTMFKRFAELRTQKRGQHNLNRTQLGYRLYDGFKHTVYDRSPGGGGGGLAAVAAGGAGRQGSSGTGQALPASVSRGAVDLAPGPQRTGAGGPSPRHGWPELPDDAQRVLFVERAQHFNVAPRGTRRADEALAHWMWTNEGMRNPWDRFWNPFLWRSAQNDMWNHYELARAYSGRKVDVLRYLNGFGARGETDLVIDRLGNRLT